MAVGIPGVHYHVGIATRDIDAAMDAVGSLFDLRWAEVADGLRDIRLVTPEGPVQWGLRRVVHSMDGPMRVELLEGDAGSVWATDRTASLHHIAYWVDDVGATVASLVADGWTPEVTVPGPDGAPTMFAYVTKPGHARVELTDSASRADTLERLGWAQYLGSLR